MCIRDVRLSTSPDRQRTCRSPLPLLLSQQKDGLLTRISGSTQACLRGKGFFSRLMRSKYKIITEIVARMFQFALLRALLPFTYDAPQIEPLLRLPRRRSSRIPQVLKAIGQLSLAPENCFNYISFLFTLFSQ